MFKSVFSVAVIGVGLFLPAHVTAQSSGSGTGGGRFAQSTVDQPMFASTATENETQLTVGHTAPAIGELEWLNTESPIAIERGDITVITFFATWCQPSRASLPRLNGLQQKFVDYGIHVIGISNESPEVVSAFLTRDDVANETEFAIAASGTSNVWQDFVESANIDALPATFIIGKDGMIEWIGHPFEIEPALEAIVHDTWDRDRFEEICQLKSELLAAHQASDFEGMNSCYDQLMVTDTHNDIYKLQKGFLLATRLNKADIGYQLMQQGSLAIWDDADALNQVAWQLLQHADLQGRPLDLPMQLAERANELTQRTNAHHLDTLARIAFAMDDSPRAIQLEELAIKFATDESHRAELQATLAKFQRQLVNKIVRSVRL